MAEEGGRGAGEGSMDRGKGKGRQAEERGRKRGWRAKGGHKGKLFRRFPHLHEWIGLPVRVVASTSTYAGIEGIVVDETKNTIVIKTHRSIKRVPKEGNIVAFLIEGGQILLDVGRLRFRPEERLKRAKLSRWEYVVGGGK